MRLALMLSVAVALGVVTGFVMFALSYWTSDMKTRVQPFSMLLKHADVQAGEQVRNRLEAQAARRHLWGAVGGGVGSGVLLTASLPLDDMLDGAAVALSIVGWFFGAAVGYSLSAVFPVKPSSGQIRVTAMQPHGMADYLHRREIAVELGLAALGWGSVMVGSLALSDDWRISMAGETAAAMMLAGAVLAVVATTALLGQHWLLGAPLRARDEDELVVADVVLAMGLRDLLAVTVSTSAAAVFTAIYAPGRTWWLVAMFGAASLIAICALWGLRKRPDVVPAARRVLARSAAA